MSENYNFSPGKVAKVITKTKASRQNASALLSLGKAACS